jgi:sialic acid synthase SpsE
MTLMGAYVTLEMIYAEVKKMNERLRLIEDVIEEVVIKSLPQEELSKEKIKEIEHSIRDMKKGDYITLEELESA